MLTVAVLLYLLKLSAAVTLPLAFGVFLIALFWPLQRRLMKHMGAGPAVLLTLGVVLLVLALFGAAFWYSMDQIAQQGGAYRAQLEQYMEQARHWANARGVPLPEATGTAGAPPGIAKRFASNTFSLVGSVVLVIAYLLLGLLEVPDFRKKVSRATGKRGTRVVDAAHRIAHDFQRYLVIRTGLGLLNGVLAGLFCWLVGLEFAFVWGLLTFLLNYIPTIGSIVATLPPLLFALLQFGVSWQVPVVLAGIGGLQLVLGNYVDPLVQGKYLIISPLVVLFSVAFWGWIWGIAGAFLGIPITVAIIIACKQSARTRWIATLLVDDQEDE